MWADLGLVWLCVMPPPPSVLVLVVLGRAAVGARQVERVLQLCGWPQDVQRVIAQLLQTTGMFLYIFILLKHAA